MILGRVKLFLRANGVIGAPGGRTAAVLSSLIATSKRLGVDPFAYLRDLFERISAHPMSRLAELLPDQWKAVRVELDGKEGR